MKTVRFVTFFLLLGFPLHARIGETLDECVKRYGSPVTVFPCDGPTVFRHPTLGFFMSVSFTNGKVSQIDFQSSKPFTDKQIQDCLAAAKDGATWRDDGTPAKPGWKTADGKLIAFYVKDAKVLHIQLSQ